ncbi:MAG: hypothetical protein HQ446_06255 [Polaromonas sp.]|nr:hypothetical protein [Polaromonas sp.]
MKASNIKREGGKLVYRGQEFEGFNKPKDAPEGSSKKKVVLAKKGDEVKLVGFGLRGMQDFTQHKDAERRKNYLARSAGIKDKSGNPTKDDVFSANHWARKTLW